jgi:hypothetical protein
MSSMRQEILTLHVHLVAKNPAFKEVHVAKPCFLYKPFTTYITCSLLMKFRRRKKPHTDFSQRLVLKKRLVFFGGSYCKSFSFLCHLIHVHFFPLCSVVFVYPSFLSFSCVLSRFCLVFGFCRFLNNSFTLFLRYSVADIERSYGENVQ